MRVWQKITVGIGLILWTSSLWGAEATALIYRVIKVAEVTHQNAVFQVDRPGYRLFEGDLVRTGPRDRAVILFANGVWVRMNTNTVLRVKERQAQGVRIRLDLGEIWSKVRKKGTSFEIETPVAVATVRGTEFYLRVTPEGLFQLLVVEGQVEVRTPTETLRVGPMTGLEIRQGKPPRLLRPKTFKRPGWDQGLGGAGAILIEEPQAPQPQEREGILEIEHEGQIYRIRVRLVR